MQNKTEIIIPNDVKEHINKRIARHAFKAAAIIGFALFALTWYAAEFWTKIRLWTVPVYVGIIVAVYFLSGLPALLKDRTWVGVIRKAKVTTTLRSPGGTNNRYWVNTVHVEVDTEDGKREKCVAFEGRADDSRDGVALSFYLKNYRPGVSIVHVRGAEHYQIDPDNNPDTMNCVVCGYDNEEGVEVCETCGHTLRLIKKTKLCGFMIEERQLMKKEIFRKCVKWGGILALAHVIAMFAYGLLLSNAVTYMWIDSPVRAMLTLIAFNIFVDAFLVALISKFETSYVEYRTSIKEALRSGEFSIVSYFKEHILKETLLRMAVGVIFQIPYMIFFSIFGFAFGGAMGIEQFYIMDSGFYLLTGSAILGVILKAIVFGIVNAGVSAIFVMLTRKSVEETMVR